LVCSVQCNSDFKLSCWFVVYSVTVTLNYHVGLRKEYIKFNTSDLLHP